MAANQQVGQGGPGRMRNTANNATGKQSYSSIYGNYGPGGLPQGLTGGGLPSLDPSAVANYYGQIQTMQSQLATTLAGLRQQRVGLRGEAKVAAADVQQQGQKAITEGINQSMERGLLGSSQDVKGRIEGQAAIASGLADIHRNLYDQLAQNRLGTQAAGLQYKQGVQGVESQAIAARMQLQAQDKQNAIAIQIANMQAQAQATQNAAQNRMDMKNLRIARQTAQSNRALANNPESSALWQTLFGNGSGMTGTPGAPRLVG